MFIKSDPASVSMEAILAFNKHLLFLIIGIVLFIGWLLFYTIYSFREANNSYSSRFVHSSQLEFIWTVIPALILLILAVPSFTLLYSMDEKVEPELTVKIIGHQWFWSYEISDFNSCQKNDQSLKYVCYMMVLDGLPKTKQGYFRLLETNKRVILPTNTHLRLLVTAADVLHSWTIPSFGLKVDACPGRLNQINLFIKRDGVFFGNNNSNFKNRYYTDNIFNLNNTLSLNTTTEQIENTINTFNILVKLIKTTGIKYTYNDNMSYKATVAADQMQNYYTIKMNVNSVDDSILVLKPYQSYIFNIVNYTDFLLNINEISEYDRRTENTFYKIIEPNLTIVNIDETKILDTVVNINESASKIKVYIPYDSELYNEKNKLYLKFKKISG
jgi:cytochrome c oxidase subunit 2